MAEPEKSRFESLLATTTSVVAPITVVSALLFYFGYVTTHAEYTYFGLDVDTVGLSNQDYVMRSPQSLLVPLLALGIVGAAGIGVHLWVRRLLARPGDPGSHQDSHRAEVLRGTAVGLAVGALLVVLGLVLLVAYGALRDWSSYDLITPLCLAAGFALLVWSWWLRRPEHERASELRTVGIVLAVMVVVANVFWATASLAQQQGRAIAQDMVAHRFDVLPRVLVDTQESLHVNPVIREDSLPAAEGQVFRFRYSKLRLLVQGKTAMFLVPDAWQRGDAILMVPSTAAVRLLFVSGDER